MGNQDESRDKDMTHEIIKEDRGLRIDNSDLDLFRREDDGDNSSDSDKEDD